MKITYDVFVQLFYAFYSNQVSKMAGLNREDWEDINITKEEVENLTQALKKEEFRKLLCEYAEEITDPKNRKQYQDDIIQLEAERGVDCAFVNPEPGFVVKTSVDGNKKAFVNICKNSLVGRPDYKPELRDNKRGLSWSIPFCQAPGREDFDNKRNRCLIYDVVFHPDTLHLAEKNGQFKKLVIETALNAVEDSFKVKLDKKNIKLPKIDFKGTPFATVIRKKSKKQPILTEEDIEFHNKIKYPFKPPKENNDPVVKNFDNVAKEPGKYTIPKYVIKHRSDIDLQEFTYDKNAKINSAIPKQLVIEVNLPLLNSTNTVTLDIMEKSLHLVCDKPVKYKLDIQLPYSVNEETGNAKFDKDRRLLIITLPVVKARMTVRDLMREDSGVESDLSPVGSVSNNEFDSADNLEDAHSLIKEEEEEVEEVQEVFKVTSEESEDEKGERTKQFLDTDKHYLLPAYFCSLDGDNICFVLNVKNVDENSVVKEMLNSHACHIKFFSIGSGFFPVHFAFLIDFKDECNIENVTCETWDNNVTVLVELVKNDNAITKYYVGIDENSLVENSLNQPLELKKVIEDLKEEAEEDNEDENLNVNVESANVDEVVISVTPEANSDAEKEDDEDDDDDDEDDEEEEDKEEEIAPLSSEVGKPTKEKCRTMSESSADEIVSSPLIRKSILKKRMCRSLSESNTEDYGFSSSIDKTVSEGSDLCIHEEHEVPNVKKTVRFSEKIRQQLFRVNSSILGRKNKNKKKSQKKRKAMERRLSESENSEPEDKERDKKTKKSKKKKNNKNNNKNNNNNNNNSLIEEVSSKESSENCDESKAVTDEKENQQNQQNEEEPKPKYGLKKDDKIFEFKSELIFDLDM